LCSFLINNGHHSCFKFVCKKKISFSGKPSLDPAHPDYIPSIFEFTPARVRSITGNAFDRFERLTKRKLFVDECQNQNTAADALLSLGSDIPSHKDAGNYSPVKV